jgi:hypothetical protein
MTEDFRAPNLCWVSHPCAVFDRLEFRQLGHIDAVPSAEANDFPQVLIGRETTEIDEQISDYSVVTTDEIHPIEPLEKGSLIRIMVVQDISCDDL